MGRRAYAWKFAAEMTIAVSCALLWNADVPVWGSPAWPGLAAVARGLLLPAAAVFAALGVTSAHAFAESGPVVLPPGHAEIPKRIRDGLIRFLGGVVPERTDGR